MGLRRQCGTMFENLTVNMTSSSQLEPAEATDVEPWAQQLDFQQEKRFEQREPPTEDNVIQVNFVGPKAYRSSFDDD